MRSAVLQKQNVESAVVVEVKKRGPGAHDLRHEILAHRPGVVDKIETGLVRDIDEPGGTFRIVTWRDGLGAAAGSQNEEEDWDECERAKPQAGEIHKGYFTGKSLASSASVCLNLIGS